MPTREIAKFLLDNKDMLLEHLRSKKTQPSLPEYQDLFEEQAVDEIRSWLTNHFSNYAEILEEVDQELINKLFGKDFFNHV